MQNPVKGHFYSCIPTVEGRYDLFIKSGGEPIGIYGVRRDELAQIFKEAGSSLLLTIRLFEPADGWTEFT